MLYFSKDCSWFSYFNMKKYNIYASNKKRRINYIWLSPLFTKYQTKPNDKTRARWPVNWDRWCMSVNLRTVKGFVRITMCMCTRCIDRECTHKNIESSDIFYINPSVNRIIKFELSIYLRTCRLSAYYPRKKCVSTEN